MRLNLYAVSSILAYGVASINLEAQNTLGMPGHDLDFAFNPTVLAQTYLDEEDRKYLAEQASQKDVIKNDLAQLDSGIEVESEVEVDVDAKKNKAVKHAKHAIQKAKSKAKHNKVSSKVAHKVAREMECRNKELEQLRQQTSNQIEEIQRCASDTIKQKQAADDFRTANLKTAQHVQDILNGKKNDATAKKTSAQGEIKSIKTQIETFVKTKESRDRKMNESIDSLRKMLNDNPNDAAKEREAKADAEAKVAKESADKAKKEAEAKKEQTEAEKKAAAEKKEQDDKAAAEKKAEDEKKAKKEADDKADKDKKDGKDANAVKDTQAKQEAAEKKAADEKKSKQKKASKKSGKKDKKKKK